MSDEDVAKGGKKADKKENGARPSQAINIDPEPGPTCPVLLNPGEWDDPPECTTISEFHKGETTAGIGPDAEDPDLEAWLDHWKLRQSQKVMSEYHQEGAPYLEELPGPTKPIEPDMEEGSEPEEIEDEPPIEKPPKHVDIEEPEEPDSDIEPQRPMAGPKEEPKRPPRPSKPQTTPMHIQTQELIPSPYAAPPYEPKGKAAKPKRFKTPSETDVKQRLERVLDVRTMEFLAYTVIRALFPRRVRYSVKKEGFIDMDVVLYDRDVILNTNRLVFEVPELAIWRIVYAYKGKPVVELGRGVKNNIKIYKWRFFRILVGLWWSKRFGKAKREAKEEKQQQDELDETEANAEARAARRAARKTQIIKGDPKAPLYNPKKKK